jgi:hypothetical protein
MTERKGVVVLEVAQYARISCRTLDISSKIDSSRQELPSSKDAKQDLH